MRPHRRIFLTTATAVLLAACASPCPEAGARTLEVAGDLAERSRQLPSTVIDYDRRLLDDQETRVVQKLIEASRWIDSIFLRQVSEENPRLRGDLAALACASPAHHRALYYFDVMRGPWDRLKEHERFVAPFGPAGERPHGAGFYPADVTKEEFERWIERQPADRDAFQGPFTVIRRDGAGLVAVPYSRAYHRFLVPAAAELREAAAITRNASLRRFLAARADAFLSDDYYASDLAWMDLDSDIEVVIGPYEVYEDELFNYKAAFESFVTVIDRTESARLSVYARHLPDMERNLPIPDVHKNPTRGTESPIRVVQEIFTAGDARRGVQTSAFNLPNDERVREAKGSKKVLIRNVMEAKFRQSGRPIAERVLDQSQLAHVSFDAYFNHVLFHELAHGLGPGIIVGPDGQKVENRLLLKNHYATVEEAKADVVGVWSLLSVMDNGLLTSVGPEALYATDVGLMFRSMRFGLDEAHGRGTAVQWNWYREQGAIVPAGGDRFRVVFAQMRAAVRSLAAALLMIEATGDYERAQRLLDRYGRSTPEIDAVIAGLRDIPVDIAPVFPAARER